MLALSGSITFSNLLFYEGLPRNESLAVRDLQTARAARVLLVSSQSGWANGHSHFAASLTKAGMQAAHIHANADHYFSPISITLMRENLWWLLGDRDAWRGAKL